ncbi:hypothetical protein DSCW_31950 [Desulfosarcina widdelii]|uniref:Uncharacterized protein n=1 Tax=Desulfosarcina widdelii TaxID=947919 RepID=A0A5K7Z469_9BACT|nr:hypothetical protein [Desulfosarcina widdelii]BBO75778.1 hypothetical protein DSCW_31950 [Desulfosarcina widdelii]
MQTKVGRFPAYVPERSLFDTVLTILAKSLPQRGMKFSSPLSKIHEFFFNMKKDYPSLFEDVNFRQSPDYKYSKEIADCFIELQEAGFLTRPNPSLTMFRVDANFSEDESIEDKPEIETISKIAELFNQNFEIINDEQTQTC